MTTVYTKPDCVQCKLTFKHLNKFGVSYQKHDVTTDPDAYQKVQELGYTSLPVVITPNGEHWAGYRPDKLDTHYGKAA